MIDLQLVPKSGFTENGNGAAFEISAATNRVFLISLEVARILEQEAIEVALEWSSDGAAWGQMAVLPQLFYPGATELALDLRKLPEVRWVRARWKLERWGRGGSNLECEFGVTLREMAAESQPAPTT